MYYPYSPEEGRGQQAVCIYLSVSEPISPDREERKEGGTWQTSGYYEIVGLHFNSTRPCQGHHMPDCVPASFTGDMALLDKGSCSPKTHPAIIFSGNIPSDDPYGG